MNHEQPIIRRAIPGDEPGIHEAHMRSIREICVKDHGEDEVRGWGNRPLGSRWIDPIKEGDVWVVAFRNKIEGHGYIKFYDHEGELQAEISGLYLTPDVIGKGFGRRLMKLMIDSARARGVHSISLTSSITAHEFYRSQGFQDNGPMIAVNIGGSNVRCCPMSIDLCEPMQ